MKDLFRQEIPKGVMQRIKKPKELVDLLENYGLLSANNYDFIQVRYKIVFCLWVNFEGKIFFHLIIGVSIDASKSNIYQYNQAFQSYTQTSVKNV